VKGGSTSTPRPRFPHLVASYEWDNGPILPPVAAAALHQSHQNLEGRKPLEHPNHTAPPNACQRSVCGMARLPKAAGTRGQLSGTSQIFNQLMVSVLHPWSASMRENATYRLRQQKCRRVGHRIWTRSRYKSTTRRAMCEPRQRTEYNLVLVCINVGRADATGEIQRISIVHCIFTAWTVISLDITCSFLVVQYESVFLLHQ
jgi:hypothetical protein